MNTKQRIKIEKQIAHKIVSDALAAGYALSVFDGEEYQCEKSMDFDTVFGALFSSDEDVIEFHLADKKTASVILIYGNDGYDVIHDYSPSLGPVLEGATLLSDALGRLV